MQGLVYSLIPRKMIQGNGLNVGKYFLAANKIVEIMPETNMC